MKICVFIGDMYRDFALSIIKHLDYYAREKGHRIDIFGLCSITSTSPLHITGFKSILSLPPIHDYDGIILCYDTLIHNGMGKDLVEELLTDMEAPPVVCIRAEISGFYNVIPDNKALMYEIAKHVISKCKTDNIGFVTGRDDLADSYERREGFEKAMKEAGKEISEDKIFHGNYWITQGHEMADFFTGEDGSLPEAVICSNDYEAIALSDALIQRGYSVPQDILISGVDNASEGEDHLPSITTIEISNNDLVDAAMDILVKACSGEEPARNVYVPGKMIFRESTGDAVDERDFYKALCDMKIAASVSMDDTRDYVIINALFEGALTEEASIQVALDEFRKVDSVKSCYLFRFRENDRELTAYFKDKGESKLVSVSFPNEILMPEGLENDEQGMRFFFSLAYKNEIYGYAALIVDTDLPKFINYKIEYLLTQVGLNINKLELYEKLFGISDVMSLYIRDPLTGILNRRGFEKKISDLFDKEGRKLKDLTIVSIDMDGLKYINDTFGHNFGDEAIKEISRCIDNALNPGEFVARMGGDEFAVILIDSEVGRVGKFIRNVRSNIGDINKKGENPYELSASIGTSEVTEWKEVMNCLHKADKAMYLEKKAKKKNR
ncbi:GGDEF domain-containing protein [Butyrivibrio sp. AE2032]|uniref:GGDEF domain-containing protein n=1 Tax=Butyrivibrio sp. AE2032 TaxID=1458463 RepID=UPI000557F0D6|nr:GGDEF domain-containing protein [Butyrivibrio sp. AE2032]